jgi:hypothetical protein
MLLTTLGLTAATAQLQGATLRNSAIPGAYPLPYGFDFSASTMRPLLHYAYECARAGRLWATFQSSDDHRGTAGSGEEAQQLPSPPRRAYRVRRFALNGSGTAASREPISPRRAECSNIEINYVGDGHPASHQGLSTGRRVKQYLWRPPSG